MNRRRLLSIFPFSLFAGKAVAAERKRGEFRLHEPPDILDYSFQFVYDDGHSALEANCTLFDEANKARKEPRSCKLPRLIESLDLGPEADYSVAVYRRLPNGTSEMVSHRLISANDNPDALIFSRDLLSPAYPPGLVVDSPAPLSKRP